MVSTTPSKQSITLPQSDLAQELNAGSTGNSIRHESSLGQADGGFQAWLLLISAFLVEILIWGYPGSYGVLLVAYLQDPKFSTQSHASTLLPLVGNLCTGIMYISALVIYPTMHWYPRIRRVYTWSGTAICSGSLILASFTDKVTLLVAFQGVLFAIGGSLVYAPVISYLSEWFVNKRGMANGIVFSGAGVGGAVFPLILPPLIARYGVQKTTRAYAICILICLIPTLPLMKARLPETRVHGPAPRSSNRQWLRKNNLWFFVAMNTIQSLGYFIPTTWLPTFASSLGLSTSQSSLALTLLSVANIIAGTTMGWLSDKFDIWILAIVSLVGTCLATFIVWGVLSFSLSGILAYGVVYGLTAGGWSSLWYGFVNPVAKDDPSLATTLFSFMLATRGIGNILTTPISTALQGRTQASELTTHHGIAKTGFDVAGGHYSAMISYAGACFAAATVVSIVGWAFDRRSRARIISRQIRD
ncbi:major facilitator superfamily domain-containing protein [Irpex rosettiformis]|uniref:Major facilitator superfamily domain-containing protein n=1 Tax=Irpex rosettiformis TaxID=378272 RepID=A0ACB8UE05_9APHY|nr:major facilitator superfamily domain-containing protein [Irpex rosettiformis]